MWKRAVAILVVGTLLALAVFASTWVRPVEKISGFIEADEIRLGSRVGGRVAEVFIDEGDKVEPGQLLVRLEPYDLNELEAEARATLAARRAELKRAESGFRSEEIVQAEQRLRQLQAVYEKLKAGPRKQEIEASQARYAMSQSRLELAQQEYQRTKTLYEKNTVPKDEMDRATQRLAVAQGEVDVQRKELDLLLEGTRVEDLRAAEAQVEEARAAWELVTAGYRPEDIAAARAAVDQAQAAIDVILQQKKELQITAPSHGVIESMDLQPGDLVGANVPMMSMLDTGNLWVRAYLPEDMHLELGRRLPVTVDAFQGETFEGEVIFIARQAEFTPNNVQTPEERAKQVFRIKVQLREGLDRLRAGMIADVWLKPRKGGTP